MIMNKPTPPTGSVYSEWSEENIVDGWTYREDMEARIAIDWGFRKPSVLIIAHDSKLGADVICAELQPERGHARGARSASSLPLHGRGVIERARLERASG